MRRRVAITLLILAASGLTFAQSVDWDRGSGSAGGPRFERGSSSGGGGRRSNDTDTYNYTPPPDPLPGLAAQYHSVRGWFRADVFPDAPAVTEPSDLPELYRALVTLDNFANDKLTSLRDRKGELDRRYRELQEQIRDNNDLSDSLRGEASTLESHIERYGRETQDADDKLKEQNSLIEQVEGVTKRLKDEAAATKDEMFRTLADALSRGRVLPPSNYRRLPEPPEPVYRGSSATAAATAPPLAALPPPMAALPAPMAALAPPVAAAVPAATAQPLRRTQVSEQQVRAEIDRILGTMPSINEATNEVMVAARRVRSLEQTASASEDDMRQLRERVESLNSASEEAASALSSAKAKLSDAIDTLQSAREKLPAQCFETAVMKYYSRQVKDFIKGNVPEVEDVSPAVNTDVLGRFAKVMSHVVELGTDTLKVIERAPDAIAGNIEDPAKLQSELDDVVNRFNVNIFSDMTRVPKPLVKYFQKRKIP
jgi:predicted  nucleic acid-binding Zn-ribbon protein